MNREEAINQLGWLKCKTNEEKKLEAVDMAIEALEALDNTQNTAQHVGSVEGLISRQDAIKEFCDECSLKDCASDCIEVHVLKSLPSADRPRGEWVEDCECSNCHWLCEDCHGNVLIATYNFCPNCGSDNRERRSDDNSTMDDSTNRSG